MHLGGKSVNADIASTGTSWLGRFEEFPHCRNQRVASMLWTIEMHEMGCLWNLQNLYCVSMGQMLRQRLRVLQAAPKIVFGPNDQDLAVIEDASYNCRPIA
jgi:hypothetical protein